MNVKRNIVAKIECLDFWIESPPLKLTWRKLIFSHLLKEWVSRWSKIWIWKEEIKRRKSPIHYQVTPLLPSWPVNEWEIDPVVWGGLLTDMASCRVGDQEIWKKYKMIDQTMLWIRVHIRTQWDFKNCLEELAHMLFNVKLSFKVGFFWNYFDLSTPWGRKMHICKCMGISSKMAKNHFSVVQNGSQSV